MDRMPAIARTAASLRILGDNLDPDEITRLLGGKPTSCERKGDTRQTKAGRSVVARTGSWRLEAEKSVPGDLNGQISAILAKLTDDVSVWWGLTQRFRCDVFCGLFLNGGNEGEQLEPSTLAALGSRGLPLGLDIYGAGD